MSTPAHFESVDLLPVRKRLAQLRDQLWTGRSRKWGSMIHYNDLPARPLLNRRHRLRLWAGEEVEEPTGLTLRGREVIKFRGIGTRNQSSSIQVLLNESN